MIVQLKQGIPVGTQAQKAYHIKSFPLVRFQKSDPLLFPDQLYERPQELIGSPRDPILSIGCEPFENACFHELGKDHTDIRARHLTAVFGKVQIILVDELTAEHAAEFQYLLRFIG